MVVRVAVEKMPGAWTVCADLACIPAGPGCAQGAGGYIGVEEGGEDLGGLAVAFPEAGQCRMAGWACMRSHSAVEGAAGEGRAGEEQGLSSSCECAHANWVAKCSAAGEKRGDGKACHSAWAENRRALHGGCAGIAGSEDDAASSWLALVAS